MSTHFYPRPPPTPSSPVRPSTAHSTIRAVTPSPPHSVPRPKSEHALGSAELATIARYVVKAEEVGFESTPAVEPNGGLGRGGEFKSGRTSPVKSRSRLPEKSRTAAPRKTQVREPVEDPPIATPSRGTEQEDVEDEEEPPETPTPMTREQKRHAYTPLSVHRQFMPRKPVAVPAPIATTSIPPPKERISPTPRLSPTSPNARTSASLSATSALSKHSIFSTPGRDELERKKALVEDDEGPFGRVKSMGDLVGERERVSSAGKMEEGGRMGKERRMRMCGVGCVIM